jgi:hypothetical protein
MEQAAQEERSGAVGDSEPRIGFWRRNRIDCALVVLVLAVVAPIVAENNAQPASRLDLTASLVEHHSVDIAGYPLGVDYSIYHGFRSDKAPGQPILATPAYALAKVVGAETASRLRQNKNLTLWWVTLWSATLPFALLLVLMRRTAVRYAPHRALVATVALGFCTLLAPYAINLYGHMLAALFAFGAWSLLSRPGGDARRLFVVGLLVGLAVFVEYEAAVVALVLLVYTAVRFRSRVGWYVLGAIPGAVALVSYQWVAFGAPWHTPQASYVGNLNGHHANGLRFPLSHIGELLWNPSRSLLITSPLVLVAVGCAAIAARQAVGDVRAHAWVALGVFIGYVLVVASSDATTMGEHPGPRFLVVAIAFLAVPLAAMWNRVRGFALIASAWGAFVMGMATFSSLLLGEGESLLHADFARIAHHSFSPTLWSMSLGDLGVVVYVVTIAAATWLLLRAASTPELAT